MKSKLKSKLKRLSYISLIFISSFAFTACEKEEEKIVPTEKVEVKEVVKLDDEPVVEPKDEVETVTVKRLKYEKKDNGENYEYVYDEDGRLVSENLNDIEAYYKFEYYDDGQLFRKLQKDSYFYDEYFYGETFDVYDERIAPENIIASDEQMKFLEDGYSYYTEYEYDEKGQRISETIYACNTFAASVNPPQPFEATYVYHYKYNDDGTLDARTWCNSETEEGIWDYIYTYDENGNPTGMTTVSSDDGEISNEYKFEMDDNRKLLTFCEEDTSDFYSYTYDDKGRMHTRESDQMYWYDGWEADPIFEFTYLYTYDYDEDGDIILERKQMVPIEGTIHPDYTDDYEFYVEDVTTKYEYEKIEMPVVKEQTNVSQQEQVEDEAFSKNVKEDAEEVSFEDDKVYALYACTEVNGKNWYEWNDVEALAKLYPDLKEIEKPVGLETCEFFKECFEGNSRIRYIKTESGSLIVSFSYPDSYDSCTEIQQPRQDILVMSADYYPDREVPDLANNFHRFMAENGLTSATDIIEFLGVNVSELHKNGTAPIQSKYFGDMTIKYESEHNLYRFTESSKHPDLINFYVSDMDFGDHYVLLTAEYHL